MKTLNDSIDVKIMDAISDMILILKVVDDEFIYEFINYSAIASGVFTKDHIGKTIYETNNPKLAKSLYEYYQIAADNNACVMYQDTYISKLGTVHHSDSRLIPLLDESMNCIYIVAIVKNISKEIDIANEVEENLQIISNYAKDLITIINAEGYITFASPSYKNVLGLNSKDFIGKPFLYNIYPHDQKEVDEVITYAIKAGKEFSIRFRQFTHKKELIWSESHGSPVFDTHHNFKHMAIITRDISEQKTYEKKLEYYAEHDALTGLPNRRLFKRQLDKALENTNTNSALIMLDIDDFKKINDSYGHAVGDEVIIEFGKRIKEAITLENTVARLGGDEFIILLPTIQSIDDACHVCEDIQRSIQEPFNIRGYQLEVTTSIGVTAPSLLHNTSPLNLFRDVDKALYKAKHSGKNTYKLLQSY